MELGMIGLGKMGAQMTMRLVRGGHRMIVYDRNPEAVKPVAVKGVFRANAIEDLVKTVGGYGYITVRGRGDSGYGTGVEESDGFRTSRGTFQKYYTTGELVSELEPYFNKVTIINGSDKSPSITAQVSN